jgi:RNA polymerase sigma factor (sigma-70 family)
MDQKETTETTDRRPLDAAGQALVTAHLHLTYAVALHQLWLYGQLMPLDEMMGVSQLALVHAASLFDASRGVPFGAYATMVIRSCLAWAITKWRRDGELGFRCFSDVLTRRLDGEPLSIDPPCPREREPWEICANQELLDRLREALTPEWYQTLELYFMEGCTMEEIGTQFGQSRERVRQVLVLALEWAGKICRMERAAA